MTNNYNWQSREIVRSWFNRAIHPPSESYNIFDRFISLWVSFNCYFVAEHYTELSHRYRNEPSERNYIDFIASAKTYSDIYMNLIINQDFLVDVNKILYLLETITHYKGKVANMQPGKADKEQYAKEFTDKNNFSQFMNVVYQVRCNLFHGNKSPHNDADVQLVEVFYKAFSKFCEEIYQQEGYLS